MGVFFDFEDQTIVKVSGCHTVSSILLNSTAIYRELKYKPFPGIQEALGYFDWPYYSE